MANQTIKAATKQSQCLNAKQENNIQICVMFDYTKKIVLNVSKKMKNSGKLHNPPNNPTSNSF